MMEIHLDSQLAEVICKNSVAAVCVWLQACSNQRLNAAEPKDAICNLSQSGFRAIAHNSIAGYVA